MICRRTKTPSIAPMTLFVVPCLLFSRSKAYVSRIPRNFQSLSTTQLLFHVDFFHQRNYNNVYDRNDFMKQKNSKFNFLFSQSSSSSSLSSSPDSVTYTTTSSDFAIDPHSEYARQITSSMGFTTNQHSNLVKLASLVVERNEQINLISRKDCNEAVVFGRHILPSVSLASLLSDTDEKIIDVGTGGGFPGLPLAILFPEREFLLVDSVRKKVDVVQAMADELGLDNLSTHHGRAEEMEISNDKDKFDIVLGRSVAALPKFCFWVQDLVASKSRKGKLIYIIGGEVEEIVTRRCSAEIPLNDLVEIEEGASMSDKRALILGADELKLIASESGEKKVNRGKPKKKNQKKNKFQEAKGSWSKKDDKTPKNRGYENFKRYES